MLHKPDIRDVPKIRKILSLLKEEHKGTTFMAMWDTEDHLKKWQIVCADFDLYTSEDYELSKAAVYTLYPLLNRKMFFSCIMDLDRSNYKKVFYFQSKKLIVLW